jgi:hypothetical protein
VLEAGNTNRAGHDENTGGADDADLEGQAGGYPAGAQAVHHFQKQQSPQEQQAHQHEVVLEVEDPDLVDTGGADDLQRRPLGYGAEAQRPVEEDHDQERPGGEKRMVTRRNAPGKPEVDQQAGGPGHGEPVSHVGQGENRQGEKPAAPGRVPGQGQRPETQPQAEIEIEEAHVEDPAVGQHGDADEQVPRPAAGHFADEGEGPPYEYQNGNGDGDSLGRFRSHQTVQPAEHQIEQQVGGLAGNGQALQSPGIDQLRQPGVVDVAGEIAGLEAGLPIAGD